MPAQTPRRPIRIVILLIVPVLVFGFFLAQTGRGSPVSAQQGFTATPRPTAVPGANLAVEKSLDSQLVNDLNGDGLIDPGDTVRFTITFRNSGSENLSNVQLVDTYDDSVIDSILNITAGGVENRDANTISWSLGDLRRAAPPGTVTYEAKFISQFPPQGPRRVESLIKITSDQTDDTSASFSMDLRIPKLSVSKSREFITDADTDGQADPGDKIRYTIRVRNEGTVNAARVLIVDNYDQQFIEQPASISSPGVNNGDVIRWDVPQLETGAELVVTYETTVLLTIPVGKSSIKNTVTVTSSGTSPITAEHSFDVDVHGTATPSKVPEQIPTGTPVAYIAAGPTTKDSISASAQAWLTGGFLLLALVGMVALGVLVYLERDIPSFMRDGYVPTLVMVAVVLLGLTGAVERSAIAGLIGTVAGYVLKGVVDTVGRKK
jgi:uncharacterized repeat protein (TIGR01451 family)